MKSIALNLEKSIFEEAEAIVKTSKISRNKYINDAVEFYNKYKKRELLEAGFLADSKLLRKSDLNLKSEFDQIDDIYE